jgi:catechol 2,3-dioxygenase-like lactoylglutathione lyase family enzyme
MSKPKIRHIALVARDPNAMARYYEKVFDMEIIHRSKNGSCFVSDGYLTMAILPHRLTGSAPVGLNHFGIQVDSQEEIAHRIKDYGLEEPKKRPADRPYAEYRACDPEGNLFDISVHGYSDVEDEAGRAKKTKEAV